MDAFGLNRRRILSLAGLSWLTPLGELLARQADSSPAPARSLILLWLEGGPSQLETFDPHPNTKIAAGSTAIDTAVKGVQLAAGFEALAPRMGQVALVRSLVSKEGDHERGTYLMKSGYRPDPTVVHPSIGAIICHELPVAGVEIPRHISILPGRWPSRGGCLGGEFDAFQVGDPAGKLPDIATLVPEARDRARVSDLDVVEHAFAQGREGRVAATLHQAAIGRARTMMSSAQLKAFDVALEPAALRASYGDTPFGRGCLAARRLIEVGVRCVEVSLSGWDSHVNNHEIQAGLVRQLDPAIAALLGDLAARGLLEHTIVLCMGEFGRTPRLNLAAGRDHWIQGFSLALAGGGLRTGFALGETDPEGAAPPARPLNIEDIHATILTAFGLTPSHENIAPGSGRPVKLSAGRPVPELLV